MQSIALVQTSDRFVNQLQQNIIQVVNPIARNPIVNGSILTQVTLKTGSNTINTGLNRALQGWYIVRQRAAASIYDTQDSNTNASQTLLLTSSADVVVDLAVF